MPCCDVFALIIYACQFDTHCCHNTNTVMKITNRWMSKPQMHAKMSVGVNMSVATYGMLLKIEVAAVPIFLRHFSLADIQRTKCSHIFAVG